MARQVTVEILGDAKNFSKATQEATAASNGLHGGIKRLTGAIGTSFTQATQEATGASNRLQGGMGKLTGTIGLATGALAALGIGMAGAFAVNAAIKSTTELGESVFKMTQAFGLSSEAASKWIYVGKLNALQAEEVAKGFKILSKHLEETSLHMQNKGTPSANVFAEEMKKLGINVFDSHKKIRDFDSVILDVADKFHKLGPEVDRSGIAMNIFGKSGTDLIPILNLGRQGIIDLGNEALKYGLVISSDNLPKIHAYVEAHRHLDAAMQGMQLTIGTTLIPILTALEGKVIDVFQAIRGWVDRNPAVITSLQNLGTAGIDFVSRAVGALIGVLTGPGKANDSIDHLAGKAFMARSQLAGKDGLADSIVKITDNLTAFLNSKSTTNFIAFWRQVGDTLSTIASWLNTIDSFLNMIVEKENQLGGFVRSLKGGTVPAGIGPKGPIAGPHPSASGFEGMVSQPTLFLAGEAGSEHVRITPHGGGGGRGGITINLFATVADGPALDKFTNDIALRLGYATGL